MENLLKFLVESLVENKTAVEISNNYEICHSKIT